MFEIGALVTFDRETRRYRWPFSADLDANMKRGQRLEPESSHRSKTSKQH